MDAVSKYGNLIKKTAVSCPRAALAMIRGGLTLERFRVGAFMDKRMPTAYRYLNIMALNDVRSALRQPETSVWANIFAPVEIIRCFGAHALSIECLSSFLSGFTIEDYGIDYADREGIASTLCSYHRNFIGAVDSGLIPPAACAVTTSTVCDGNTQTFRHLSDRHGVPMYLLDVPESWSAESEDYLVGQLVECISMLEDTFHKRFDMEDLSAVLKTENTSRSCYGRFLDELKYKAFPSTLTMQMYMLFATHLMCGSPEMLKFFKHLEAEIRGTRKFDGKRILWVHLVPYYQETLKSYFNLSDRYQIQAIDLNLDYERPLDPTRPLHSLAKKMILNLYNGSYNRKARRVQELAYHLRCDGVIHFCHWGCRQSSGGVMLLKEKLKEIDVPLLILDGDGIDRRGSHDGQIRTRLEAFFEMLG